MNVKQEKNQKKECGIILWTNKQLKNKDNINLHLLGTSHVPETLLSPLHVWIHFILTITWWDTKVSKDVNVS